MMERSKGDSRVYNYKYFLFRIFTNRRIPFPIYILILYLIIFMIPMILFYQFWIGVNWTNFFYLNVDYLYYLPEWWTNLNPHIDWSNILFVVGGFITISLSKGLYEKAYDLKTFMLKSYKNKENIHALEEKIDKRLNSCFRKKPLTLFILIVISIPILWFYLFCYDVFLINPEKTVVMWVVTGYALVLEYGLIVIMMSITLDFGLYIRSLSKMHIEVNVYHPDRVGGLKIFGIATIRNLIIWTVAASFIIFVATGYIATSTLAFFYLYQLAVLIVAILISIFIFFIPLYTIHKLIIEEKKGVLQKNAELFRDAYKEIRALNINSSNKRGEEDLLLRLNVLTLQNYYNNIKLMRDWPWDTNILYKFSFSLLIPVIVAILNIFVMQVF